MSDAVDKVLNKLYEDNALGTIPQKGPLSSVFDEAGNPCVRRARVRDF